MSFFDVDGDDTPCSFEQWLYLTFDHDASTCDSFIDSAHQRSFDIGCSNSSLSLLTFITRLFEDPLIHLAPYAHAQINMGLNHVITGIGGDMVYVFHYTDYTDDEDLTWESQKQMIYAIYNVYEQIFEPRCDSALSYVGKEKYDPLNNICTPNVK